MPTFRADARQWRRLGRGSCDCMRSRRATRLRPLVCDGTGSRPLTRYPSRRRSRCEPVRMRSSQTPRNRSTTLAWSSSVAEPRLPGPHGREHAGVDAVQRLIARGGVYAGCSAGAMVAGAASAPHSARGLRFPFASGLGLLPTTAVGVHSDATSAWWIRPVRDLAPRRVLAPSVRRDR